MRIGIDCRSLQEPEPSGVSAYTRETLRSLVRLPQAQQHTFVCFVNGFGLQKNAALVQSLHTIADGPHVEWRVLGWPNKLLTSAEVALHKPSLRWMFGGADVAFIPNLQFFSFTDRSMPFVLTIHDLSFERYPECLDFKGRLRHRLVRPRESARAARSIITVSDYTKMDVQELYGIAEDRIDVVYPGILPRGPVPVTGTVKPYVAFISTVEPRKNVETLLQAMIRVRQQNPEVELVIIGRQGWKSADLVQRLRHLPFVHYKGYVDEATKQQILAGAKAFVYPSLYEGFGFPPLEAQRCGVPVIAGAHSSLPEVVGGSALLVDVLDVDSVARGIHHVLNDAALRSELVTAGHKNVARFQWNDSAARVLNILTGV